MLVSFGIWSAFAAIVRRKILVRGAVISGVLMFLAVAALGYVAVGSSTLTRVRSMCGRAQKGLSRTGRA
jgi:hypothetical protein